MHKKVEEKTARYWKQYGAKNDDRNIKPAELIKCSNATVDYDKNSVHNRSNNAREQPGENASWKISLRIIVIHIPDFILAIRFTTDCNVQMPGSL